MIRINILICGSLILYALSCNTCVTASQKIKDMADNCKKNNHSIACGGDFKHCLTIKSGDDVVMMGCGIEEYCDLFSDCTTCTSDNCNFAPSLLPSWAVVGIISCFAVKYLASIY